MDLRFLFIYKGVPRNLECCEQTLYKNNQILRMEVQVLKKNYIFETLKIVQSRIRS
jgi:hypothetical protein